MPESGQVEYGRWEYSDPVLLDRDEVRLLIGDTKASDQLLSDEEIEAALRISERSGPPGGLISTAVLFVLGAPAAGATSIDLDAPAVTGTVAPGDSFVIAGDATRYRVTNTITASTNVLAGVTFRPGLAVATTDNTAVTFRFANTYAAAALCLESLARQFARKPDETIGDRTTNYSQISRAYAEQATLLRQQGAAFGTKGGSAQLVRC